MPPQGMNQHGPYRPPQNQGPPHGQFNGNVHPGMRQQMLPGHSPQMLPNQALEKSSIQALNLKQKACSGVFGPWGRNAEHS